MKIAIYKITNRINDKKYIGKTSKPEQRWKDHRRGRGSSMLHQAIIKYGIENFSFEIIEWADDPNEREQFYINLYQTYYKGYNQTLGGDGGRTIDEEIIEDIYNLLLDSEISIKEIAELLNVGNTLVNLINNGRSYRKSDIVYPIRKPSQNREGFFLKKEDILAIEDLLIQRQGLSLVAKEFGVNRGKTLSDINNGKHLYSSTNLSFPLVRSKKATKEEVLEIEAFIQMNPNLSLVEIGKRFGREREMISKVKRGIHRFSSGLTDPIR